MSHLELSTSDTLLSAPEANLSREFLFSAAYSGLQAPVSGLAQIVDKVAGTKLEPTLQFIDAPKESESMSYRWHAQQFGAMVGTALPFLLLHKGVSRCSNALFGKLEQSALNEGLLARRLVGESAATGAVFEGVFRPVDERREPNFLQARINHSVSGALTFAALSASAIKIQSSIQGERGILGRVIGSEIGSSMLAGIPAGLVSAEVNSVLGNGTHASWKQIGESIYSFSVLGGAMAAGKRVFGATESERAHRQLRETPVETETTIDVRGAEPVTEQPFIDLIVEATYGKKFAPARLREVASRNVERATTSGKFEPLPSTPEVEDLLRRVYPQLVNEGVLNDIVDRLRISVEEQPGLWGKDLKADIEAYSRHRKLATHLDNRRADMMHEVLLGKPEPAQEASLRARAKRFEDASEKHALAATELKAQLLPALRSRAQSWTKTFNEALVANDLLPMKFIHEKGSPAYVTGFGKARIGLTGFADTNWQRLAVSSLHEYLHFMQDVLVARSAEQRHVAFANDGALEYSPRHVRESYNRNTDAILSNRMLKIARQENKRVGGAPDSLELWQVCRDLEGASRSYPDTSSSSRLLDRSEALKDAIDLVKEVSVEALFRRLTMPDESVNIFYKSEYGEGLRRALFRRAQVPGATAEWLDTWQAIQKDRSLAEDWCPRLARSTVLRDLQTQYKMTNRRIDRLREAYFGNYQEVQAYALEHILESKLGKHGLSTRDQGKQ